MSDKQDEHNNSRILLKPWDLQIKTLENEDKVVQVIPYLAFNKTFIREMEALGVKEYVKFQDKDDDSDDDDSKDN
jgi:hypothetical protein